MKTKLIIGSTLLIVILSGVFSCMPDRKEFSRSMATAYYKSDKISLRKYQGNRLTVEFNELNIIGNYKSEGFQKNAYDRLCEKHNDMTYNRKILISGATRIVPNQFIYADLASIEVTSDRDFDSTHPAGTSLNDIVMFLAVSPKKYIDSGYKDMYDWKSGNHIFFTEQYFYSYYDQFADTKNINPYHPVEKMVSDLNTDDMTMLGNGVYGNWTLFLLSFTTILPIDNRIHNITVTLTTDEGETFSDTINMTFE